MWKKECLGHAVHYLALPRTLRACLTRGTMIISCPACSTRYAVPDTAIGIEGRTVRCAKCRHSWFQDGPKLDLPPPSAPPEPALAAVAAEPQPLAEPEVQAPPPIAEPVAVAEPEREEVVSSQPEPEAEPWPAPEPEREPEPEPVSQPEPEFAEPAFAEESNKHGSYAHEADYSDYEESSAFDYEPPFRPRINRTRMWTWAASLFAVVSLGLIAAVGWYGLPEWMPMARTLFAEAQPGLVLDFPRNKQDRRTLPNGTSYFGASGTITNIGKTSRSVPMIMIVLRDAHERIVYTQAVAAPVKQLAPGESVTINQALTDIPKSAKFADFGWKPG